MSPDNPGRRLNWAVFAGTLALVLLYVFTVHRDIYARGFFQDDFNFLAPASQGIYGAKVGSWLDWLGYWSPWRGWFYRPVFLTWMGAGLALWGENSVSFHVAGLVLHALVVTTAGLLVLRLTKSQLLAGISIVLLLAWPRGKESFYWIAAHSSLLAALFSLLAVHAWLTFRESENSKWKWFAIAFYFIGMCSKNDAVTTAAAFVAIDLVKGVRPRKVVLNVAPAALALVVFVACEWIAAKTYAEIGDPGVKSFYKADLFARLRGIAFFADWVTNGVFNLAPASPSTFLILGAIISVVVLSWRHGKHGKALVVLGIWGACSLVPVPLISPSHSLSDRFAYVPSLALVPFLAVLAHEVLTLMRTRVSEMTGVIPYVVAAVALPYLSRLVSTNDPAMVWFALLVYTGLLYILWRSNRLRNLGLAVGIVMIVGAAAASVGFDISLICAVATFGLAAWLLGPLAACGTALVALVGIASPVAGIPLVLIALSGCHWWMAEAKGSRSQEESREPQLATTLG